MHGLNLLPKQNPDMQREKIKKNFNMLNEHKAIFTVTFFQNLYCFPNFQDQSLTY